MGTKVTGDPNNHYKIVCKVPSAKRYIKIADVSGSKHAELRKILEFCMLSASEKLKRHIENAKMADAFTRETLRQQLRASSSRSKRSMRLDKLHVRLDELHGVLSVVPD